MAEMPGIARPERQALPQLRDRMTFLYLEHCTLGRQDGAITVTDEKGIVQIPAAGISVTCKIYRQVSLAVAVVAPATVTVFAPFFTCF